MAVNMSFTTLFFFIPARDAKYAPQPPIIFARRCARPIFDEAISLQKINRQLSVILEKSGIYPITPGRRQRRIQKESPE